MNDDLVKRLRLEDPETGLRHSIATEAADNIEKLEKNFELQLEWYLSNKRRLDDRIEDLEAALSHYACGCKEDKCTPEKQRYRNIKCGWPARQALEGKKNE